MFPDRFCGKEPDEGGGRSSGMEGMVFALARRGRLVCVARESVSESSTTLGFLAEGPSEAGGISGRGMEGGFVRTPIAVEGGRIRDRIVEEPSMPGLVEGRRE